MQYSHFAFLSSLQVLHCLHHDGTGGENPMVDGFHAADVIRRNHPQHFDALCRIPLIGRYLGDGRDLSVPYHTIAMNPITQELEHIRWGSLSHRTGQSQGTQDWVLLGNPLSIKSPYPKSCHCHNQWLLIGRVKTIIGLNCSVFIVMWPKLNFPLVDHFSFIFRTMVHFIVWWNSKCLVIVPFVLAFLSTWKGISILEPTIIISSTFGWSVWLSKTESSNDHKRLL